MGLGVHEEDPQCNADRPHLCPIEQRVTGSSDAFPFSVPAIRSLTGLELSAAVTFFVGENGSGKPLEPEPAVHRRRCYAA